MALSNEIVSQFAKLTNGNKETEKEDILYGTVVISDGKKYVRLDGSNMDTPISSTTNIKANDRVMVMIKDHAAIVTGNITSPSADQESVDDLNNKTDDISNQVTKFGIIVSYKISTDDITALNATFEAMKAISGKFSELVAVTAEIETLQAKIASVEYLDANDISAINAEIENIQANFGSFTGVTTEDLNAFNAEITNLTARVGNFTYVSTEVLNAMKATIRDLDTKKLSAEQADLKYANIDFSNIGEAAIEKVFADSGIIKDLVVSGGKITGELVGVTIKGDLIEGNTIKADKLVVKGSDGIYYKLNFEGGTFSEGEEVPTNGLHGSVIVANSITAEKIRVDDLVAFGATIGGFHITNDSLYSGVKSTVDNTTRGIYLDNNGQIAFGDSNSYIKYYQDQNGDYKLEISAGSILIGSSGKNVETIVDDAQSTADAAKATADDAQTTALRAESSIPQTANAVVIEALSGYVPFENVENEDGTVTEGYNSKIAALEARIKATEGRVTTEVTNRTIANQGLQSQIEEITNRMVFDENGLTFKNLTNGTESPYKINIDNDELKFLNGNEAVQTFDAYGNSVIPNLKVLTIFNLFGYVFSKDASGNLNLDYVGGDK